MRIAVIGAGISGLVAAHHLCRRHDVTVFEAADRLGGHTNTVPVEIDGERLAVDTGFIVFNDRTYPEFVRLLDDLGVASRPSSMSFSVRCDRTGLEYNGTSLNRLYAQRSNLLRPRFHGMVLDILRFHRDARRLLAETTTDGTVADFIAERGYGDAFVRHYLVPMGSAIWSCPPGTFRRFSIRFVATFFDHHGMLTVNDRPTWRVVTGGSAAYLEPLARPFRDSIILGAAVRSVRREPGRVLVTREGAAPGVFDHVVLACHSDQALAVLDDADPVERAVLGALPYHASDVVLHTDTSLLPRRRRAWASWNYHLRSDRPDDVTVTYNMNILQSIVSRHTFCVTLNETDRIDPARVLGRFRYAHPVFTAERVAQQRRHAELIDRNRTSYCGAYWGNGFHEDGVRSALAVSRALTRMAAA